MSAPASAGERFRPLGKLESRWFVPPGGKEPKGRSPAGGKAIVSRKRTPQSPTKHEGLEALLERDPICLEIATYLSRHADAVDTARGIADWWINRQTRPTEEALGKLLKRGVVRPLAVQGTTCVYAYTKNRLLRRSLARYLKSRSDRSGHRRRRGRR